MAAPTDRTSNGEEAGGSGAERSRPGPAVEAGSGNGREASRGRLAARRTLVVLPTLLTLGNCLCGFLAIFFASRTQDLEKTRLLVDWTPLTLGAVFVFLGTVCDAFDGRLARFTQHTSDLGEQLDSMADMVTFGVAPAFLAVQLVEIEAPFLSDKGDGLFDRLALVIACIYVACAALRLARFNIETASTDEVDHLSFEGLPTPGAAGTVASLVLLHQHFLAHQGAWTLTAASITMVAVTLLVALAMISRMRYVHVMNRFVSHRAPIEYIAMAVVVGLLMLVQFQGVLAAGFLAYALSAPLTAVVRWLQSFRKRTKPAAGG